MRPRGIASQVGIQINSSANGLMIRFLSKSESKSCAKISTAGGLWSASSIVCLYGTGGWSGPCREAWAWIDLFCFVAANLSNLLNTWSCSFADDLKSLVIKDSSMVYLPTTFTKNQLNNPKLTDSHGSHVLSLSPVEAFLGKSFIFPQRRGSEGVGTAGHQHADCTDMCQLRNGHEHV